MSNAEKIGFLKTALLLLNRLIAEAKANGKGTWCLTGAKEMLENELLEYEYEVKNEK